MHSDDPINIDGSNINRGIRMDPDMYDDIKARAEHGEYIDFKLPDDSTVPRLSDRLRGQTRTDPQVNDEIVVDPNEVFSKIFGGGKRAWS
jgi:hypothetical protein